jgi:P27 family predicted phage terminase small subunit
MKRGPKPTPTAILKQRGSWRANRPGEPTPEVCVPNPPAYLNKAEKAIFRHYAKELAEVGIMSRLDVDALARYCTILLRWRTAEAKLSEGMPTHVPIMGKDGKPRAFASTSYFAIVNKCHAQLRQLEADFGLSPANRVRLEAMPTNTLKRKDAEEAVILNMLGG